MNEKTPIKEVWIAEGRRTARIGEIHDIAQKKGIPVIIKNKSELNQVLPDLSHQGFAALIDVFHYTDIEELVHKYPEQQGLLIALDHITDEGNLGAIIRTAVFFNAHGMIIPKDRAAAITAKVLKRASGAYVHLPISRVVNISRALDFLKEKGLWIIGAAGESQDSIYEFDWNRPVVLVLGNEQRGLSPSVRKKCDQVVGIPVLGKAESLNVAVASGVILSEIIRQRCVKTGLKTEC